jgi:ABC-type amino acid transport substrate-binding protein
MLTRVNCLVRMILMVWGLVLSVSVNADKQQVEYFILAQTSEPIMIVRDGDPMAGGIFTDIVKQVFNNSDYIIIPRVMPWQRMREELKRSKNWVAHGFPSGFESDIPYQLSEIPIFPFKHVAMTLVNGNFPISKTSDLFGKTVILVENFHYTGLDKYLSNPVAGTGSGDIDSVRAFSPTGTLEMLRHKRGDVVIGWRERLLYHLQASGLSLNDVNFQDASRIVPIVHMHFAFSPNWSETFKQHVNSRLKTMQADGSLARIFAKYNGR